MLEEWKKGLENHLPIFEAFLKKVTMKQMRVNLEEVIELEPDEATELLKQSGGILVKAVESSLHLQIYFSFGTGWGHLLSKTVFGEEQNEINEITQDLLKEFADNILKLIESIYDELGIKIEISELSLLKPGQIKKSMVDTMLYSANLNVIPKFEMSEEESSTLPLTIMISKPDEERLSLITTAWGEKNPLLSGNLTDLGHQNLDKFDFQGFSNRGNKNSPGEGYDLKMQGQNVEFEEFEKNKARKNDREVHNLDLLKDVEMTLSVQLGTREMSLGQILQIVKGSVIELEKLAGEPVEILINGRKIAEGDVVVIDEHFGIRISKLLASHEKIKAEA